MMRSEVCSSSAALVTDMPGTLTGIYISVPSFSVGMNSEPSRLSGITVAASTSSGDQDRRHARRAERRR